MSSLTVLKRIAQGSILALGVLLLLYILLYFTWEGSGFARLYQARVLPVAIESVEGSDRGVVAEENSVVTWPGPLPSVGDTVLAILDTRERRVSPGELPDFFREPDTFTVRYVHEGEERTAALVATKPDVDLVSRVLVMEIFRFLGSFGFVLVGLWAFSTRPGSPGVWSLVLFSFGLVVLILRSVSPFAGTLLPTFQLPGRAWFHANSVYLLLFFPAFWFQLVLLFPNPHEWLRRRPALVLGLNFGLPLLLAVNTALGPVYPTGVEILMVLHVFAAFTLLFHRAAHAETPLEKRQFRLVSVGTILGLGALFLVLILGSITGYLTLLNPFWRATLLTLMYACLFLIPITFAYAFGRYGLLEVEGRIRRNTRYAAITVVFILLFVLAENGAVELGESLVGQESRLPSTAVAIVFALMFSRATNGWSGKRSAGSFPNASGSDISWSSSWPLRQLFPTRTPSGQSSASSSRRVSGSRA